MKENKIIKLESKDISLSKLLTEMQNNIYEHNDDVQFVLSEKCVKKIVKGLKNASVHKNSKETIIVFVANNKAADTEYMMILVGDNKTGLYKVKQAETNDKQYPALNRNYGTESRTTVTFVESRENLKNNNFKK